MPLSPLPTPTRVLTIIQLCISFSVIMVALSVPFLNEHLTFKKQLTLYKIVMGHLDLTVGQDSATIQELQEQLQRNQNRYVQLPLSQQRALKEELQVLTSGKQAPLSSSLIKGVHALLFQASPFLQLYLFLSLAVSFLILFRIEGASSASWLVPLALALYALNNQMLTPMAPLTEEQKLYPTEQQLIANHLKEPLSPSIQKQYHQLKQAWEHHLIHHWSGAPQSSLALEEGEFHFNLARIQALKSSANEDSPTEKRGNGWLQCLGLIWSLVWAGWLTHQERKAS